MKRVLGVFVALNLSLAVPAGATQFTKGALIIPMDTTHQNTGTLKAYGLLYQLLKADVPVHWVIKLKKKVTDFDFKATATDYKSGAGISHSYRGGPFVIAAGSATKAGVVIKAWQAKHTTTVHVAAAGFPGRTGRLLTAAPTIAVIADGTEDVAFKYLNAAGIPDSKGQGWPGGKLKDYAAYPDILTITEIAGPTTTKHTDGKLFRTSGQPAFCQIMTMHWDVKKVDNEVVAEYREFLKFPTHFMAECQAVNAIENSKNGFFLTTKGFLIDNNIKDTGPFAFSNSDTPYAQMDGTYNLVGGSEQAYTLAPGSKFHDSKIVMIKDATTAAGVRTIWMTGYLDGKCSVGEDAPGTCSSGVGKISYLGGHKYEVKEPISTNPTTVGTRLFLNSLFEAGCTTYEGQPLVMLTKTGAWWTTNGKVTYTLSYGNYGPGPALDVVLADKLPVGSTFVSATGGGTLSGTTVTWKVGDLASAANGSVQLTVSFATYGNYTNSFTGSFRVGVNTKSATSNTVTTSYQKVAPPPDAGTYYDMGTYLDAGSGDSGAYLDTGSGGDASAYLDTGSGGDASAYLDTGSGGDASAYLDTGGAQETGATDADPNQDIGAGQEGSPATDLGADFAGGYDSAGAVDAGTDTGTGGAGDSDGCDCRVARPGSEPPALLLLLLLLGAVIRRVW